MKTNETLKSQTEKIDRGVIVYHDEQILVSGMKVWRSENEYTISGLDIKTRPQVQDKLDTHDWLWRVFDGDAIHSDTGRKININWGSNWGSLFGSLPIKNILEEEVKNMDTKFYNTSSEEDEDLDSGNWHGLVESHMQYFMDVLKDIMNGQVDTLPIDEARAVAFHALCDFAKKISDNKESLRARFRTSAYSWVKWYYQEELARKEAVNNTSTRHKLRDRRTLNEFIKDFKSEVFRQPTVDEIKSGLGWGESRIDSTYRLFDFHIGKYRKMNDEEMLYTVMDYHLTDRQADIVEMSYGLGGTIKMSLPEIAEELNIGRNTAQADRSKAMEIIKEQLGFKYDNRK